MDSAQAFESHVNALPVESRWAYRRVRMNEWVRERFWSIPLALIAGGVLIAVAVSRPDLLGLPPDWDLGSTVRPSTAGALLQVMASSMLTFVGVVFAITLVGLQLASSQLSPRVIRTFIRSAVTKTAFGVFLAAFAFAVTALAFDNIEDPRAAARTGVVAVSILAVSVVVFVIYVTATMRLLEVGWVITAVANEARGAIRHAFPPADAYRTAQAPQLGSTARTVHLPSVDTRGYRGVLGTVLGIDRARLVRLATDHGCVIEFLRRPGEYVPTGGAVFAVHGGSPPDDARVLACLDLGRSRTLYQDPTFGVRQLVDVATQALSPAVNQMSTSVQVIDRLQDLLLRIGRQPVPSGLYVDDAGAVRLIEPTTSPAYILTLAFEEISQCGATSWHVTRRLSAAYADLREARIADWEAPLVGLQESLDRIVRANALDPTHRAGATYPDRLGLG